MLIGRWIRDVLNISTEFYLLRPSGYIIRETFSFWTFKQVHYIDQTEVICWGREIITDDKVSCIEFGIIYDVFYFIVKKVIGFVGRGFTNGLGDLCSIPGRVIPVMSNQRL